MRVATIDIGTNTVLLLVAEPREGKLVAVEERAEITRLGQGVDKTRQLAPDAIERTNGVLSSYGEIIRSLDVKRVAVVGTSAMRDAGGGQAVRDHVKSVLGVEARTISGEEEARLTFAGALSGLTVGTKTRVFDIGGGSTEVVHGDAGKIVFAHSFDVGSVRMTERHGDDLDAIRASCRSIFASVPDFDSDAPPVGIAGTMTTLAAVALEMRVYDGGRVHGHLMKTSDVEAVVQRLAAMSVEERRTVAGMEPKRADVIVAGGVVALAYLERIGAQNVMISDRGVRWGLAEDLRKVPQ